MRNSRYQIKLLLVFLVFIAVGIVSGCRGNPDRGTAGGRVVAKINNYELTVNDFQAEAKVTAANMANLDTPGYRTVGFDFDAAMRKAIAGAETDTPAAAPKASRVDGLVSRPDGNNVSMDREGLSLADAQLKYRTGVALLRIEYQRTMDAIHAQDR